MVQGVAAFVRRVFAPQSASLSTAGAVVPAARPDDDGVESVQLLQQLLAWTRAQDARQLEERQAVWQKEAAEERQLLVPSVLVVVDALDTWKALRPHASSDLTRLEPMSWRLVGRQLLVNVHVTSDASDLPAKRWEEHLLRLFPSPGGIEMLMQWQPITNEDYATERAIDIGQVGVIALKGFDGTDDSARPTLSLTTAAPIRTYVIEVLFQSAVHLSNVTHVVTMDELREWMECLLGTIRHVRNVRVQTTQWKGQMRQKQDKVEQPAAVLRGGA